MKQTLLGYRGYEFEDNREKGRIVKGVSLYTMYETDGVTGHEAGKISVSAVPSNIDDYLGTEFDVEFNGKGKVIQVRWPSAAPTAKPTTAGK